MPKTMKQLIPVMFFPWYAMFCYWQYLTSALSLSLYETVDQNTLFFNKAQILTGNLNDTELGFLRRHSRNHNITPSDIPYQANIDALNSLELNDKISVSACGSLNENYKPGDFVLVDQYIDRTFKREKSFRCWMWWWFIS